MPYRWMAAAVAALAAAGLFMTTEVTSMDASEAGREIPAVDREAPEAVKTATFAVG